MLGALRWAVGLLTIVPIRTPQEPLTRTRAGWAVTLAPVVGLGLWLPAAGLQFGARNLLGTDTSLLPPLLSLGLIALLTGGLHWDGLVDLVDGLACRKPRDAALAVMATPGVGALGVAALVAVALGQVAGLELAIERHHGTVALLVATLAGRLAVVVSCTPGIPAARPEGLGALVAGSIPRRRAAVVAACAVLVAGVAGKLDYDGGRLRESVHAVSALAVGLAAAWGLRRLAVRRFGGITGDVLGAQVEIAAVAALFVMALRFPRWLG